MEVYAELQKVNNVSVSVEKELHDYTEKEEKEKKVKSAAGIIVGVVAVALTLGGVVYCKCAKKCCFAEDEMMGKPEGGQ